MSVLILDSDYDELLKLRRKNRKNKKLQEKCKRLTNNWNELEEWLKEQKEDANKCIEWNKNKNQYYDEYKRDIARFDFILDKMEEIKEGK